MAWSYFRGNEKGQPPLRSNQPMQLVYRYREDFVKRERNLMKTSIRQRQIQGLVLHR